MTFSTKTSQAIYHSVNELVNAYVRGDRLTNMPETYREAFAEQIAKIEQMMVDEVLKEYGNGPAIEILMRLLMQVGDKYVQEKGYRRIPYRPPSKENPLPLPVSPSRSIGDGEEETWVTGLLDDPRFGVLLQTTRGTSMHAHPYRIVAILVKNGRLTGAMAREVIDLERRLKRYPPEVLTRLESLLKTLIYRSKNLKLGRELHQTVEQFFSEIEGSN